MAGLFSHFQKRSLGHHPYCAAVVVAAGSASRMKGIDKIMTTLGGIPVLARTLQALQQCQRIDEIVVVTRTDLCAPVNILCREYGIQKVTAVIPGGATRAESVRCGLCAVSGRAELAAIHDGARPFVSQELLERVLIAGAQTGAAAPAVPVKDTIKRAENGIIQETVDRSTLFAVQTPQVFQADFISAALYDCIQKGIPLTDDCSAAEHLGKQVTLVEGEDSNIKLTTPADLAIGEALLQWQTRI